MQFTLPFEDGADLNYIYPQALAKQLAPYSNTSAWANHDIAIEINHDVYMNSINYDKAYSDGWNNTGVPPGGLYYFQASDCPELEGLLFNMRDVERHDHRGAG